MRTTWHHILSAAAAVILLSTTVSAQDEFEDDPLAELAALGDEMFDDGVEGGGSIRAKRGVDMAFTKRIKDPRNIKAKVVKVQTRRFPIVAVHLKISKPAKEGPGTEVKKNQEIVVLPSLKLKKKSVDMKDADTMINAGAFYLRKNDKVVLRLGDAVGKKGKGKVWYAQYIEREK